MPLVLPATMAMPLSQADAMTTTGCRWAEARMPAAMPKVAKSTEPLTTASLLSAGLSKGTICTVVLSGTNRS